MNTRNGPAIQSWSREFEQFGRDESGLRGTGETISFPTSEAEAADILRLCDLDAVTIQGSRTGITGGAVPDGGHLMNLSGMKQVLSSDTLDNGEGVITVEAGMTLDELHREISLRYRDRRLFWPPEPTETSASVGGVISCGARGICASLYGGPAEYVTGLHYIDKDGNVIVLDRRNAGEAELLDRIVGSEGIFGPVTQASLRLVPVPETKWGVGFFFSSEESAAVCADHLFKELPLSADVRLAALEFMDSGTLELISSRKPDMSAIRALPDFPEGTTAMLYLELHGRDCAMEDVLYAAMEIAEKEGSDPETSWAMNDDAGLSRLHALRHAAAECVNQTAAALRSSDERIRKLGTDMCVPGLPLSRALPHCREQLREESLKFCIFGHASDCHLHVNILPASFEEYEKGRTLIRRWSEEAMRLGGSPVCEHGMGRLKREMLSPEAQRAGLERMTGGTPDAEISGRFNPAVLPDL